MRLGTLALLATSFVMNASAAPQFTLALQLYTFKDQSMMESIETAKRLGFSAVELTNAQKVGGDMANDWLNCDLPADKRAAVSNYLARCGIKAPSYGVVGASDEAGWRKQFEFIKSIGGNMLIVEPDPKQLPLLDKLAQEYRVRIHIHNHAKTSPWWDPAFTEKQVAACSEWVGAGSDIGHWVAAGINPPDGIRTLMKSRIFALHFVDGDKEGRAHPYGTGEGHLAQVLDALREYGKPIMLTCEYEEWKPETEAHVAACIRWFNDYMKGMK